MTHPAATHTASPRNASAVIASAAHETATSRDRILRDAEHRRVLYRLVLVIGMVVVATLVAVATSPVPAAVALDAALVRLMRGMAMIKAGIVAVAAAVLWWRFARPVPTRFAVGYLLGAWCMAAATVLIWQLASIGAAALAFHTGELSLLLLAWRDSRSRSNRS